MAQRRSVTAMVAINRAWIERVGTESLLSAQGAAPVVVFPVAKYSLADPTFAEITYYPRSTAPRWLKLHIPRNEVLAIIEMEKPGDVAELGFVGKVESP